MQLMPAEQSQQDPRGIASKSKLIPESKKQLQIASEMKEAFQKKRPSKQSDQRTLDGGTFYMTHVQHGSPGKQNKSRLMSMRAINAAA